MVMQGHAFGAHGVNTYGDNTYGVNTRGEITGEVVFATGMTGYLETLTDPSYYGQIVLQTFPLIGNYGVIPSDFESAAIGARAYIVRHPCQNPSNFRSEGNLDAFLKERAIIGLCDIDSRALTRIIRTHGVMNGKIMMAPPAEADIAEAKAYSIRNAVAAVSSRTVTKMLSRTVEKDFFTTEEILTTEDTELHGGREDCRIKTPCNSVPSVVDPSLSVTTRRVALMDFGAKRGIAQALMARGCEVWSFPHDSSAQEILKINPQGIMLSNGPGDPAESANNGIIETLRILQKSNVPIFGICLGHQLLALANGYSTKKLKFGHRGANQPVKELATGRVYITSQNHGYAVVADNGSFVNVNDGTCEGMDYGDSFSVQFHPEARGGPLDTGFLFDRFIERMNNYAA
jgi:carbamoyl-phosphate synthase small subunit